MDIVNALWNVSQQMQLGEIKEVARDARIDARMAAEQTIEQTYLPYVKQLDKLGLVCQALWTLVQEKTDLTDKDLLERMTELDLKDGVLDGKQTKPPVECPKCGSMMCRKFNRCLFCGEEYSNGSAFDTV